MAGQSRCMSALEAVANVAVGSAVALATNLAAFPLFGLEASLGQHLGLTAVFTAVLVVRSYLLRRAFEALRVRRGSP